MEWKAKFPTDSTILSTMKFDSDKFSSFLVLVLVIVGRFGVFGQKNQHMVLTSVFYWWFKTHGSGFLMHLIAFWSIKHSWQSCMSSFYQVTNKMGLSFCIKWCKVELLLVCTQPNYCAWAPKMVIDLSAQFEESSSRNISDCRINAWVFTLVRIFAF